MRTEKVIKYHLDNTIKVVKNQHFGGTKMKNIEMMKQYIRENNLTGQVRELVNGADMDSEDAIEYVYDAHVMSKKDFAAKYFG